MFTSTPNCVSYLATLPASFGGIGGQYRGLYLIEFVANIVSRTSSFEAGYVSFFHLVLTKSLQMFVAR